MEKIRGLGLLETPALFHALSFRELNLAEIHLTA